MVVAIVVIVVIAFTLSRPQTQPSQQEDDAPIVQGGTEADNTVASEPVSIPNLSALCGVSLDEAQELLGEDFKVISSEPWQNAERGGEVEQGVVEFVVLQRPASDGATDPPTVTLGLNAFGAVVTTEFSCSMDTLEHSDRSFAEVIADTGFIQQSLESAGIQPAVTDLEPPSGGAARTYEKPGDPSSRLLQETCDFTGQGGDGTTGWWILSLTYNYRSDAGQEVVSKTLRISVL
jgi:hypothetical protein